MFNLPPGFAFPRIGETKEQRHRITIRKAWFNRFIVVYNFRIGNKCNENPENLSSDLLAKRLLFYKTSASGFNYIFTTSKIVKSPFKTIPNPYQIQISFDICSILIRYLFDNYRISYD
jgi:hypothetical protein